MAGRRVRNRMKLKTYIEKELQKQESRYAGLIKAGFVDDYLKGWVDSLKWVLSQKD